MSAVAPPRGGLGPDSRRETWLPLGAAALLCAFALVAVHVILG